MFFSVVFQASTGKKLQGKKSRKFDAKHCAYAVITQQALVGINFNLGTL